MDIKIFSISGYRATDIAKALNVSRQRVSALALRYEWTVEGVVGHEKIYHPQGVNDYLNARRRADLMKRLGRKVHGLFWEDEYDSPCPECGEFAIFLQPRAKAYFEDPSAMFLCVNGHGPRK